METVQPSSYPYLVFNLLDKNYGVSAHNVQEIVRLPEITPMEEAPSHVIGVINLRGQVVPVLDLNIRLGRHPHSYKLSDAVIVVRNDNEKLGIIVTDIQDVMEIPHENIDDAPTFSDGDSRRLTQQQFIKGVARIEEQMIMLLSTGDLLLAPIVYDFSNGDGDTSSDDELMELDALTDPRSFHPEATQEERAILQQRAKRLMRILSGDQDERDTVFKSLAVITLHGEFLGIDLNLVRGFAQVRNISPVPCCPGHIIGDINLRGDILTVVDMSSFLNLKAPDEKQPNKAVVLNHGDIHLGVLINDIIDVIQLQENDIAPIPAALGALKREYLLGAAPYENRMLSILDLERILTSGDLVVNETI
ncbi:MAG: chemotaxis protein CheW [Magnetococcales bacterium]|nr:chemotaxis protein CheW [Magnetococcales bacterium]